MRHERIDLKRANEITKLSVQVILSHAQIPILTKKTGLQQIHLISFSDFCYIALIV